MIQDNVYFESDIFIEDGKISKIDKVISKENLPDSQNITVINAKGAYVLPGFIQGHIHLVQTLLRHHADDMELLDWLKTRTWPFEAALDGDAVEASSLLGAAELLLGGTTTICDFGTTHSHQRVFEIVDKIGLRYIGGKVLMDEGQDVPAKLLEKTESSLQEMQDLGSKWHNARDGRIKYAVTPRFVLSCTEELLKKSVELARAKNWYLQTHSSENKSEIAFVKNKTGLDNIHFLHKMGFTGSDTILAHCVHLNPTELLVLENTKTRVCHCPGSNLKLASGIADVPELLRRNIHVMLGADGAPCNNRLSIFHEMTLAATLHKVKYGPKIMPAWQVLGLATREAAKALNLEKEIGTLEVGKKADIVIIQKKSLSMYPGGDPASQIVYGAHPTDVSHVFVDGKMIVKDSLLTEFHLKNILDYSVEAWDRTHNVMNELL